MSLIRHVAIGTGLIVVGLCSFPLHGQNVPNATGVCVANCDAPAPPPRPQRPSQGSPALPNAAGQFGYELGRAIGRSLSGQTQQDPARVQNQLNSAQQYLDQWENEDPDKNCSEWSWQPDRNHYFRLCMDERGHRYCQARTKEDIVRISCTDG